MWQTFRQYKTSLDFELVKAEVLENDDVFKFTSDEKQLSFRLREFPDNPLQLTPINDLLKIHGLKPYRFLRDLRITKSMALNLRKRCPDGIDFKLDKEVISHYDRNETVERLESMLHWRECECKLLRNGGEPRYQTFLNAVGRLYENNENRRLEFAEDLNDVFSYGVCLNGFRWKTDGSLVADADGLFMQRASDLLNSIVRILLSSGFLQSGKSADQASNALA